MDLGGQLSSISPDGSKIIYNETNSTGGFKQYGAKFLMDFDGGNLIQLAGIDSSRIGSETWSPDGSMFAVVQRNQATIFKRDGSTVAEISYKEWYHSEDTVWSPDGARIFLPNNKIYSIDNMSSPVDWESIMGSQDPNVYNIFSIHWAPDGQHIAFEDYGNSNLYTTDADGSNLKLLYSLNGANAGELYLTSWAENGRIYFYDYSGARRGIYSVKADGTDLTEAWS